MIIEIIEKVYRFFIDTINTKYFRKLFVVKSLRKVRGLI